jgi:hypothetical protein
MWSTFPTSISPPETQVQYIHTTYMLRIHNFFTFPCTLGQSFGSGSVFSDVDPDPYEDIRDQAAVKYRYRSCSRVHAQTVPVPTYTTW